MTIPLSPIEVRLIRKATEAWELEKEACDKMRRAADLRQNRAAMSREQEVMFVLAPHGIELSTDGRWSCDFNAGVLVLESGDAPTNGGKVVQMPQPPEEPLIACGPCTDANGDEGVESPFLHAPPACSNE